MQNATAVATKAAEQAQWAAAYSWTATAIVATAAALDLLNYKKIVGLLLLKIKAKVTRGRGRPKTLLFGQEVAVVIAAVAIVAIAIAAAWQFRPIESFTTLGLLGPKGKIGGHPDTVKLGQEVKLYVYVYNHMGHPAWLRVAARWLDNLTNKPSPDGFYVKELSLGHDQSVALPIVFKVDKTDVLEAELWMYKTDGSLIYTNGSVHLWIKTK